MCTRPMAGLAPPSSNDGRMNLEVSAQKNGNKSMNLKGTPDSLKKAGNKAISESCFKEATHLYTLAIDILAEQHSLNRDADGRATPAGLFTCHTRSSGEMGKLLSNRSLAYLRLGDHAAALEDALACVHCDSQFEKGHVRVVCALQASGASIDQQFLAIERGLAACPNGELLRRMKEKVLKCENENRAACETPPRRTKPSSMRDRATPADPLAETKKVADDLSDPRHFMAAGDFGAALAVGAHGASRDVKRAEHYLRAGARGDIVAKRNLGILLLETDRPEEAAAVLNDAAQAGDEEAASLLRQVCEEAQSKELAAREKLLEMASSGDPRAAEILRELSI